MDGIENGLANVIVETLENFLHFSPCLAIIVASQSLNVLIDENGWLDFLKEATILIKQGSPRVVESSLFSFF